MSITPSVQSAGPHVGDGRVVSSLALPRFGFLRWHRVPRLARQVCVAVFGTAVLLTGVAMIVLPGPAVLVIPLALAILGTEFPWARKLLQGAKARILKMKAVALRRRRAASDPGPAAGLPNSPPVFPSSPPSTSNGWSTPPRA
jgi:uncharacterized protein (TIGR02611 family)